MADLVITLGSSFRTQLYVDGAPVENPTGGGGDTGGGDTGGGDTGGGDTGPTPITYSTETENSITTIESLMYVGDELSIFNDTISADDYTIVKDLNTVTGLEDVMGTITIDSPIMDPNTFAMLGSADNMYSYATPPGDLTTGTFMPIFQIDESTIVGLRSEIEFSWDLGNNNNGYILYSNVEGSMYPASPIEPTIVNLKSLDTSVTTSNWYILNTPGVTDILQPYEVDGTLVCLYSYENNYFQTVAWYYNGGLPKLIDPYDVEVSGTIHKVSDYDFNMTYQYSPPSVNGHSDGDYVVIWSDEYSYVSDIKLVQNNVYTTIQENYMWSFIGTGWNNTYYFSSFNLNADYLMYDTMYIMTSEATGNSPTGYTMGNSFYYTLSIQDTLINNLNIISQSVSSNPGVDIAFIRSV